VALGPDALGSRQYESGFAPDYIVKLHNHYADRLRVSEEARVNLGPSESSMPKREHVVAAHDRGRPCRFCSTPQTVGLDCRRCGAPDEQVSQPLTMAPVLVIRP